MAEKGYRGEGTERKRKQVMEKQDKKREKKGIKNGRRNDTKEKKKYKSIRKEGREVRHQSI